MKKLSLWLCPVALVALGTSARAGSYDPLPASDEDLQTYYVIGISVPAVTAFAPRNGRDGDSAYNPAESSGISQKTWVWHPTAGLNEPIPAEQVRCRRELNCNVYAEATPYVYVAEGVAHFTVSIRGQVVEEPHYFMKAGRAGTTSNTLVIGQPSNQLSPVASQWERPVQHDDDGLFYISAQASVTVGNSAAVNYAVAPEHGSASSGQASIRILDFTCADETPAQP